jgi:transposase-like protein
MLHLIHDQIHREERSDIKPKELQVNHVRILQEKHSYLWRTIDACVANPLEIVMSRNAKRVLDRLFKRVLDASSYFGRQARVRRVAGALCARLSIKTTKCICRMVVRAGLQAMRGCRESCALCAARVGCARS